MADEHIHSGLNIPIQPLPAPTHLHPVMTEIEQERRQAKARLEHTRLERDRFQIALQGIFHLALETELEPFCTQALELIARISGAESGAIIVSPRVFGETLDSVQPEAATSLEPSQPEPPGQNALSSADGTLRRRVTLFRSFYRRISDAEHEFLDRELYGDAGILEQTRREGQVRHIPDERTSVTVLENFRHRYVLSALIVPFAPDKHGICQAMLYLEHCARPNAFQDSGMPLEEWKQFVMGWLRSYAQRQLLQQRQDMTAQHRREERYPELTGRSSALADMLQQLELIRRLNLTLPVLLLGEDGCGRETVASVLHRISPLRSGPFHVLRLKDAPQDPSVQLFGQEGDGRHPGHVGLLERCRGGTLYISNVDLLPVQTQKLLLKSMQESRFSRLGGALRLKLETRLLVSCSRPLAQVHREGHMLEALAELLSPLTVRIPPLRERKADIPAITERILLEHGFKTPQSTPQHVLRLVSASTLRELEQRMWPGNLTELRECLLAAWQRCDGWGIEPEHLSQQPRQSLWGSLSGELPHWHDALNECQRQLIKAAMERADGKVKPAAELLGISRQYLNQRLNVLDMSYLRRGGDSDEDA